jgi:hypothetical protein
LPKERIVANKRGSFSVGTAVSDSFVDALGEKSYSIFKVMLDDFQNSGFMLQDCKFG